jgi:hypothetical protein
MNTLSVPHILYLTGPPGTAKSYVASLLSNISPTTFYSTAATREAELTNHLFNSPRNAADHLVTRLRRRLSACPGGLYIIDDADEYHVAESIVHGELGSLLRSPMDTIYTPSTDTSAEAPPTVFILVSRTSQHTLSQYAAALVTPEDLTTMEQELEQYLAPYYTHPPPQSSTPEPPSPSSLLHRHLATLDPLLRQHDPLLASLPRATLVPFLPLPLSQTDCCVAAGMDKLRDALAVAKRTRRVAEADGGGDGDNMHEELDGASDKVKDTNTASHLLESRDILERFAQRCVSALSSLHASISTIVADLSSDTDIYPDIDPNTVNPYMNATDLLAPVLPVPIPRHMQWNANKSFILASEAAITSSGSACGADWAPGQPCRGAWAPGSRQDWRAHAHVDGFTSSAGREPRKAQETLFAVSAVDWPCVVREWLQTAPNPVSNLPPSSSTSAPSSDAQHVSSTSTGTDTQVQALVTRSAEWVRGGCSALEHVVSEWGLREGLSRAAAQGTLRLSPEREDWVEDGET